MISNLYAARIFKTWPKALNPSLLGLLKKKKEQQYNSHPVQMHQNYTFFIFVKQAKNKFFWCAAESQFVSVTRRKRLKIAALSQFHLFNV